MSPQTCNPVKVAVSAVLLVLVARTYATTGKSKLIDSYKGLLKKYLLWYVEFEATKIILFYSDKYSLSDSGRLCSETGEIPLDDKEGCKNAESWILSKYPDLPSGVTNDTLEGYPKGCHVYLYDPKGIYFNAHLTGAAQEDSRQVCKKEVKGTLSNALDVKWISCFKI